MPHPHTHKVCINTFYYYQTSSWNTHNNQCSIFILILQTINPIIKWSHGVRPSVCLSVLCLDVTGNNAHQLQDQRSKFTRSNNAETGSASYLPNGKAYTNMKLVHRRSMNIRITDSFLNKKRFSKTRKCKSHSIIVKFGLIIIIIII